MSCPHVWQSAGWTCQSISWDIDLDLLRVMHQLVRLLISRYKNVTLRQCVCKTLGVDDQVEITGQAFVETLPLLERYHLVPWATWPMVDLAIKLESARRAKTVPYKHMRKDFEASPGRTRNR